MDKYWSKFEHQAAKDFLAVMIGGGYDISRIERQVEIATKYAKKLTEALMRHTT